MSANKVASLALALTASVAFAFLASGQTAPAAGGKDLFLAQKCNMCHSVPSAQIEKTTKSASMAGPDLLGDMDKDKLVKFMKKEVPDAAGKTHSKEWKGTEEELNALADWLLENKKPA